MRLLDLYCGAGGAAAGYYSAGFTKIVGVDNRPQKHYPFTFVLGDAIDYLAAHGHEFDAIHASPPCQAYMDTHKNGAKPSIHPRLIEPTRALLLRMGVPYVIENVHKAPLNISLMLCGTMFGLRVIRHRYFECSFPILPSPVPCNHWGQVASGDFVGVYAMGGRGHRHGRGIRDGPPEAPKVTAAEAMGIDWMNFYELTQAIPSAYTEFVGKQLVEYLKESVHV